MVRAALVLAFCAAALPAAAQTAAPDGIPVRSDLVTAKCGGCHRPDDQKRLSRISFRRTTPEGWERTIKRMISLNRVSIEPAEARAIVKYLADNHGLSPEEARTVTFESERRNVDFKYAGDAETAVMCASCHSIGRVLSERRTKEEWNLLISMHRGYYPLVDNQPMNDGQGFRRNRTMTDDNGDKRQPVERVVAHLSGAFPLTSGSWSNWAAARPATMLAGRWALKGYVPGKGAIFGTVTITADPQNADTFTTDAKYTFAATGETAARKGRSVVYAGFQWRGRLALTTAAEDVWREVMLVERNQQQMSGRWFGGGYEELGMEVTLMRVTADPLLLGASAPSLKSGSSAPTLRLYGANLPAKLTPAMLSLGQGVTVTRIAAATPDMVTLSVDVAPDAVVGPRDVVLGGAHLPAAFVVYDTVGSVKVLPQAGLARVGGAVFPKQFQQFEAVAYHNGADGQPNTADDIGLGAVPARWTIEEYAVTFNDDDTKFVGAIDEKSGLFTPNVDGPNPQRSGLRNNVGDVWVVAEVAADPAHGLATPVRSRAHLVVSVPVFVDWAASETGQ